MTAVGRDGCKGRGHLPAGGRYGAPPVTDTLEEAGVFRVSLPLLGAPAGEDDHMTLGVAPRQRDLLCTTAGFCEGRVAPESIYGVLHRECFSLFPDEMFADLFTDVGRRSVPPDEPGRPGRV